MKSNQRLEYGRVAEVLAERGVVDPTALQEALQASANGTGHFAEILVNANLVSDWELSAIVCDLYNLPFVTVAVVTPEESAREDLDPVFLRDHALVPLSRFGKILTVSMPAIVPAEVLGQLAAATNLQIIPVVGTVRTNRRWLEDHLKEEAPATDDSWSSFFDVADEQVMLELDVEPGDSAESEAAELTAPPSAVPELDGLDALDDPLADEGGAELELVDPPALTPEPPKSPAPAPAAAEGGAAGKPAVELPPLPKFDPPAPLPETKPDESRTQA